jgi:uncharacterized protein YbjT (DUF2867 family)
MDVAIAGGHGRIALQMTRMLTDAGDRVRSLIRDSEQGDEVAAAGGEPVLCDLELAGTSEIGEAIAGVEAVVFAAGAGPGSGASRKETVDYGAAVKLIAAARAAGVRRYLMISTRRADPDHPGDEVFDAYLRAKGRADAELARSGLVYTIVRPGRLTDERPSGRVRVGESVGQGSIPRGDVAAVLAACLRSDEALDRAFEVISGEVPIAEAVPPAASA